VRLIKIKAEPPVYVNPVHVAAVISERGRAAVELVSGTRLQCPASVEWVLSQIDGATAAHPSGVRMGKRPRTGPLPPNDEEAATA
jgi:hypothetical protein